MPRERLLSVPFVLGFAANFLHSLAFHSYVHLPGFLRGLGAGEFVIGIVMGAMAVSAIASRPAVGRVMDTRGRRVVVLVGGALNVAVTLSYLTVDSLGPWIIVVRVFHGVADGMLFSVLFTIAADIVPPSRRTEGIALFGVSGLLPLSLAALAGDAILAWGDYTDLFVFTSIAAGLGALAGWRLPDSRPDQGPVAARSFWVAVTDRPLRPLWLVGFAFAIAVTSYFTFLKTFVADRGVGSMGLFFTAYTVAAVGLRLFLGWVPDRIGPRRMLFPALITLSIGLTTLAFATGDLAVGAAGLLCGAGHGYAFPITSALVVTRARESERGTALAAFTALFDVGLLLGAPTFGLVLARTDYTTMFLSAAALTLCGTVAFGVWDRRAARL